MVIQTPDSWRERKLDKCDLIPAIWLALQHLSAKNSKRFKSTSRNFMIAELYFHQSLWQFTLMLIMKYVCKFVMFAMYAIYAIYGLKCLGKIIAYLMSFFLLLCDWSVPYCASLEAWNCVVAGQHLDMSHPRSSVGPKQNVTIFLGDYFFKTLNCHIISTVRAFDLIQNLKDRPEYQLSSGIKYTAWLVSAFPPYRNHP